MKNWMRFFLDARPVAAALALVAGMGGLAAPAAGAPAMGETYVYQVVNAYNREVLGKVRYEVVRADPDRVTLSVSPDHAAAGAERTEILTKDGNRLRGVIESHGLPVEYEFATAYPAYVFPLDPGKSWSLRVNASVPSLEVKRIVRVDGRALGTERIRVPAGEFDAIKVRRYVYPGDEGHNHASETRIVETEWYAPALGLPVRTERNSEWINPSECGQDDGCDFRGSWEVIELVEPPAGR